ncbi:MAG: hypothetical protein ACFBRM_11675 [Pikeienuella sp.]
MNSGGGNRKSMDDVLSSIRRIIGADKKEGYDDMPDQATPPQDEAPLTLGDPIMPGNRAAERPAAPTPDDLPPMAPPAADPLSLTPNMRVDFSKLTDADDVPRQAPPEPTALAEPAPMPEPQTEEDEALVIDEAALEDMIRRIVREEIATAKEELEAQSAAAREADLARQSELDAQREAGRTEAMRQVVRDELMGETGQNISRNVQRMIQAELERLLAERG